MYGKILNGCYFEWINEREIPKSLQRYAQRCEIGTNPCSWSIYILIKHKQTQTMANPLNVGEVNNFSLRS